jgi:restriction system protein
MVVPDFQSIMLPLLKITGDSKEHTLREAIDTLSLQFLLSDEDKKELLPSGRQQKFANRVGWSRTYLKKAGLLESTGRGKFRITERGYEVLKSNPSHIDVKFLERFPSFLDFKGSSHAGNKIAEPCEEINKTPEELLEASYLELHESLAQELLDRVKKCPPEFFENLVVDLLVAMGYGGSLKDAGKAIGKSGDGGVDGIIKEDKLGLDVVYIQAKRWENTVGRPVVQAFAGSLMGLMARKGVLITTSQFSQEAVDYVGRIDKKIVLIEGKELAQLIIDHGIGVAEVTSYTIKRIDLDYFGEE